MIMTKGLLALIGEENEIRFFSSYEENKPFHVRVPGESFDELAGKPFLASLDALLNSWPHNIQAHLPDVRDEVSSIDVFPKDAKKLFDNGMGLLFNEAEKISPELSSWLHGIQNELGLSRLTYGRCLIYATPDGKGTAPHFDQNINFVLQIHGAKKWSMAPNHHVHNPMTRHTMGQDPDPELASYLEFPLPDKMPDEVQTYELTPGSILFVPRGYWHSTEAEGDALALNFTFTAPTWIDLFTTALRSRLSQVPEWRSTADGVSSIEHREMAQMKLDKLLAMIVQDLPHWRAEDILSAIENE
jgi:50S ribosomal protein L16 3-hydroxylase